MRQRRMFSYVVDHDMGVAPNPVGRYCTLAKCKFSQSNKRNLVEMADAEDWVIGTGGVSTQSAGHGRLIYAMRISRKIPLREYSNQPQYAGRVDRVSNGQLDPRRYALISDEFYYFGRNAIDIAQIPQFNLPHRMEKRGPGYRRDFPESFIAEFERWIRRRFEVGIYGEPCGGHFSQRRGGSSRNCKGPIYRPRKKLRNVPSTCSEMC
jgi:Nucleotide modification associated domain 2